MTSLQSFQKANQTPERRCLGSLQSRGISLLECGPYAAVCDGSLIEPYGLEMLATAGVGLAEAIRSMLLGDFHRPMSEELFRQAQRPNEKLQLGPGLPVTIWTCPESMSFSELLAQSKLIIFQGMGLRALALGDLKRHRSIAESPQAMKEYLHAWRDDYGSDA